MHTSFQAAAQNRFDRHFGGTKKGVADPYVSGYHFIMFKSLPSALERAIRNDIADLGISSNEDIQRLLSASCLSVTPPGGTLNRAEFTGLGGTKWSVPTNIDYGNTISVRFLEYSRLPIFHIFHSWFRLIREYRTGTSMLTGSAANDAQTTEYTKKNFSGTMLYWTTKPDGVTVEYSAAYTGVFPTKDPQDSFPGDITAVDKLEIDMEFSLDWIWKEKFVRDECQFWANVFHAEGVQRHGGIKIGAAETNVAVGDHADDQDVSATSPN